MGVGCVFFWFDWWFVLVVPVCGCLSAVYQVYFCFGLMPLFLCFRGGAVRFSFFGVFLTSCVLFVGFRPFGINSYSSKKKKGNEPIRCESY